MAKEIYKLSVEPITCVHIGSGEQLTTMEYKVSFSKKNRQYLFVNYSKDSVLKRVGADEKLFKEFDNISNKNDFKELSHFFHVNSTGEDTNYTCQCTEEFLQNYEKNQDKNPIQNGMFVEQMYHPQGKATPVIPGSSLKGAIRTAVLNLFLNEYAMRNELRNKKDQELQQKLLENSDAKNDPFRAVQIGDCTFAGKGTQIVGLLKNIKKDRDGEIYEHNTSQIQAEVIKGYFMPDTKDVNLIGQSHCVFNSDLWNSQLTQKAVSKKITPKDLIKMCNSFYWREFKNEYNNFYRQATGSECNFITELYKELKSIAENSQNQDTFILRVGRWSQVEFVTYGNDFRNPKTPKRNGRQMPYGTTRTVFNYDGDYLPLGWCKCTLTKAGE